MNWNQYFMTLCYFLSMKSKDEKTKHGAVIVGQDNEIRSTGYNSFPRGIKDYVEERQERPEKYFWFEHAERNAIYNAARIGVSTKDCILYVEGIPCMDCARAIVQAGIKKVVVHKQYVEDQAKKEGQGIWNDHSKRTIVLFEEAFVELEYYDGEIIRNIHGWRNGELV